MFSGPDAEDPLTPASSSMHGRTARTALSSPSGGPNDTAWIQQKVAPDTVF